MDNLSPYQYRSLADNEFRLLKISTSEDTVTCSLVHFVLADAPNFQALSYAWGTGPPSQSIECDGRFITVTEHLLKGLKDLERQFGAGWFWIDAICINQQDDTEKAVQVPRMTVIYSSATRVVVWLGPAYDNSDLAMGSIPSFNQIFAKIENLETVNQHTLIMYGLPAINDPVWLAILKLAFRDWFSRLWVVQEVALAQSIIILGGEIQLEFQEMVEFFDYLRPSHLMWDIILEYNFQISQPDHGFSALPLMGKVRQMRSGERNVPLLSLLRQSRRKSSAENVDKVYGMLGLMNEVTQAKIKVDYSLANRRDFWQVYIGVSRILLEDDGFFVLSIAPSDQKHPNLPSWCPDFRHDSNAILLSPCFCAGLAEPDADEPRIPKSILSTSFSNTIEFRGLEMDKVKELVELLPHNAHPEGFSSHLAELVLECEARCLELSKMALGSNDDILTQHAQTLVAGTRPDKAVYDTALAVEDYHNMRALCQAAISGEKVVISSSHDQKATFSALRYLGEIDAAWEGSSFFSTEGGQIGIASKSIKAGDSICIFFNAQFPHILHFDPVRKLYLLVGAAYVSGLMTGEAFYAKDPINNYKSFLVG